MAHSARCFASISLTLVFVNQVECRSLSVGYILKLDERYKTMTLPMSFDDVAYYKRSFNGDIIITHGVMYYFPNTKLIEQKEKNLQGWNRATRYGGLLFLIGDLVVYLGTLVGAEVKATVNQSLLRNEGLWLDKDTSQSLQARLDPHISELKREKKRAEEFSSSLPLPMRFTREDIEGLSLNFMGKLVFEAHYDRHDFFVNPKRKKLLREALSEGGFL